MASDLGKRLSASSSVRGRFSLFCGPSAAPDSGRRAPAWVSHLVGMTLSVHSPDELIAVIPHLLGFKLFWTIPVMAQGDSSGRNCVLLDRFAVGREELLLGGESYCGHRGVEVRFADAVVRQAG